MSEFVSGSWILCQNALGLVVVGRKRTDILTYFESGALALLAEYWSNGRIEV